KGQPSGKAPQDFRRAFALVVNEFSKITPQLKQLESSLPIAAKNQMQQRVQLYAKVFTSAERVDSLAGEMGVEPQMASRFSVITGEGKLKDQPLFSADPVYYRRALQEYVSRQINLAVEEMR